MCKLHAPHIAHRPPHNAHHAVPRPLLFAAERTCAARRVGAQHLSYSEFIDSELIHFSNADNVRATPRPLSTP
eukprot:7077788-Prymnesium_polylepis.2